MVESRCIVGVCVLEMHDACWSRCGMGFGQERATPGRLDDHLLRRPLRAPQNTTRTPAMHRGPGKPGGNTGESMLTANRSRAGRTQCELGDSRIDDHGGLEVPRQLKAGKGQDVRALPLSVVSQRTAPIPSSEPSPRIRANTPVVDDPSQFTSSRFQTGYALVALLPQPELTFVSRMKYPNTTSSPSCRLP